MSIATSHLKVRRTMIIEIVQDMDVFRKLTDNGRSITFSYSNACFSPLGIDPLLAQHIAHLFIRDRGDFIRRKTGTR